MTKEQAEQFLEEQTELHGKLIYFMGVPINELSRESLLTLVVMLKTMHDRTISRMNTDRQMMKLFNKEAQKCQTQ